MKTEDLSKIAGGVVLGGFDGTVLPSVVRDQLAQGRIASVTLFKHNIADIDQAADLCATMIDACGNGAPPLIAVDQEGGRVVRFGEPVTPLPSMRVLGQINDPVLTRLAGQMLAEALSAFGVNLNFAPVADVDSNPNNPIIGDRSFGNTPELVARHVVAMIEGLQQHGLLACAKHFPGHGDTSQDSHLELPNVAGDRAKLETVELVPFRAAISANVASIMTAHVTYQALSPDVPATLSHEVLIDLLRRDLNFAGVCFSDDLHMKAVSARMPVESAGVQAIEAGCDALLICFDPGAQERTRAALEDRARHDSRFATRLHEAFDRVTAMRQSSPPRPVRNPSSLRAVLQSDAHRRLRDTIAARTSQLASS